MAKRVRIVTRDLIFRAKLRAVAHAAGAAVAGEGEDHDVAVIEAGSPDAEAQVRAGVDRGIAVLVFGSHVDPEALRAYRALGARAVPNSRVESTLLDLLTA
ncbi:MAG: hypothetical protein Q8Q14_02325 [Gemmatimonadales bacterium]|nr:hypothetical protein [Gemmatimonadales bacterium]